MLVFGSKASLVSMMFYNYSYYFTCLYHYSLQCIPEGDRHQGAHTPKVLVQNTTAIPVLVLLPVLVPATIYHLMWKLLGAGTKKKC